jgi:hypothetical protein
MEEIDRVRAGNRMIEVRRFRITEAGARRARRRTLTSAGHVALPV